MPGKIRIVPYDASLEGAVAEFNVRLKAAGVTQRFSESHVPFWLPPAPGCTLYVEYFVAVDPDGAVRGCYGLKHQDFAIGQEKKSLGFLALPISEGIINRNYAAVGVQLLMHAMRYKPLLYALGLGGTDESITHLVRAARWPVRPIPFYFHVVRPYRFLRNVEILRRTPLRRACIDALAFSGLGWLAGILLRNIATLRRKAPSGLKAEVVDEFADWADEVWRENAPQYPYLAVRDAATLRILYPKENPRFIRLRVSEGQRLLGWAVLLATDLSNHKQFGNMRLGSIVDVLASPAEAEKIIIAAERLLCEKSVDLIISNQAHGSWCNALRRCGFLEGPSNFLLATSQKLTDLLDGLQIANEQLHLNRGDGDGPINL